MTCSSYYSIHTQTMEMWGTEPHSTSLSVLSLISMHRTSSSHYITTVTFLVTLILWAMLHMQYRV